MNVVITGASRGIGKSIAELFAANGFNLLLTSKGAVGLYQTMEKLQVQFPSISIKAKPFNISEKEQAKEFGNWCLSHSVPDLVINNAGAFEPGSIHNEREGLLEEQLAINLQAAYHLTRTLLPKMKEAKQGHIFNICSIAALKAYSNGGAYSISKYALHGFSKNLREELKSFGIKVTSVFPGAVFTDSWGDFDNSAHRIMLAEDVAKMIFAASQLSPGACVEDIVMRPQLGDL
ncbi:MAG: SDR family oxidoreductase [Chitinophagaceae bacterium]|nr:MAG: SDR family oxidoreductase [Chitinophagaceae bacterium]